MKWSGTFLIWPRKSVGNPRNACYAQSMLWEELLTLTHQSTCRDSIYSKGKVQRHFFGEPASRGSRWGQNRHYFGTTFIDRKLVSTIMFYFNFKLILKQRKFNIKNVNQLESLIKTKKRRNVIIKLIVFCITWRPHICKS